MALEKMTENVEIVQTLSTYPNQEDGLSAEELKAKFDAGAKAIKEYLNGQVVPAVQELERVVDPGMAYGLDTTLSVPGRAADAGAVGNRFTNLKAADVGARPNTWLPSIDDIGAAPAGYGFGEDMLARSIPLLSAWEDNYAQLCAKVDNMLQSMADYTAMLVLARGEVNGQNPYENSGNCLAVLYKIDDASAHLVTLAHGAVSPGTLWRMHKYSGVWQEPEWVNPPMEQGVEYRTTERQEGKVVYKRKGSSGLVEYRLEGETNWRSYGMLYGLNFHYVQIQGGGSVRFRIDSYMLMMCRCVATTVSSAAVYAFMGYHEFRAPAVTELSVGSSITISTGGDDTNGWFIEVHNNHSMPANMHLIGSCIPTFL